MGSQSSKPIKVATANYSGITNSPFEFYSENTEELDRLNAIFKDLFSQIPLIKLGDFDAERILSANTNYNDLKDKQQGEGKHLSTLFDWKITNIQKSLQKGRYCPQYREDAGVQNGGFLKMSDFFRRWDAEFNKNIKYVKVNEPNLKKDIPLDKQRDVSKVYDFLIFKTFVEYNYQQVYKNYKNQKWMDNYEAKITIKDRDTNGSKESRTRRKNVLAYYQSFMQRYHRKPYLKHELKFKFIKKLIETHDIVFVQDCCDEMINEVKNEGEYTIIQQMQDRDCFIIIRSNFKRAGQLYDAIKYIKQQRDENDIFNMEKFNYSQNNDPGNNCYPAICLVDRFLLMSVHMSSRKQKKYEQITKFMNHVLLIHQKYDGKLQIVVGGDFNSNIKAFTEQQDHNDFYAKSPQIRQQHERLLYKFWNVFSSYPENIENQIITTRKKRTWLQSQAKKSQKNDELSRDFLISNFRLQRCKVISNGTGMDETLPTQKHPFDHFFISAEINKLGERA